MRHTYITDYDRSLIDDGYFNYIASWLQEVENEEPAAHVLESLRKSRK